MTTKAIKAVVLGGGTGSASAARGLKRYAHITAVLTTCDDGGSSNLITQGMGIGPVGDIRQFLLALADENAEADLSWRFAEPPFSGHPLGNIVLAGLIKKHGLGQGIERFREIYGITDGTAIPMTPGPLQLWLKTPDGRTIVGESELGEYCEGKGYFRSNIIPELKLRPTKQAILCQEAIDAIAAADVIIVPPGKLTSVGPLMLIDRMKETLQNARKRHVPIIGVVNIMSLTGQTDGLSAAGHINRLEGLLGHEIFTHVVINTAAPSPSMVAKYAKEGEKPVPIDPTEFTDKPYEVVGARLLSPKVWEQNPADLLPRTVLRHDSDRLADLIVEILLKWRRQQESR
jgi:uncharacterized cofD-like protein